MQAENDFYYEYGLTAEEFAKLKKGELVLKNFFPPLEPQKLFCVVAWNKDKLGRLDPSIFEAMRKGGISVANCPLATAQFQQIENEQGVVIYQFAFGSVVVGLASLFKEAKKPKEAA